MLPPKIYWLNLFHSTSKKDLAEMPISGRKNMSFGQKTYNPAGKHDLRKHLMRYFSVDLQYYTMSLLIFK